MLQVSSTDTGHFYLEWQSLKGRDQEANDTAQVGPYCQGKKTEVACMAWMHHVHRHSELSKQVLHCKANATE